MVREADVASTLSSAIAKNLGSDYAANFASSGFGGGGGASVGTITDANKEGPKLFYKSTNMQGFDMLNAEYQGVKAMYETGTIRVPKPICLTNVGEKAFLVFEHLDMGGRGNAGLFGRQLAQMHKATSANGQYGFAIDNTCGATPQPNSWKATWAEFWDEHRLGHIMKLCRRSGGVYDREQELRQKVRKILSEHEEKHDLRPSLVHGDLWTGNAAYMKDGTPVIFDPATYYGDREVDLAMSKLFGSFGGEFYKAYSEEYHLPEGWQQRETIYNMYHMFNHYVLFGGGYWGSATRMADEVLGMED
ncbi:unnamed protein product [Chrysoparadoxa australica]